LNCQHLAAVGYPKNRWWTLQLLVCTLRFEILMDALALSDHFHCWQIKQKLFGTPGKAFMHKSMRMGRQHPDPKTSRHTIAMWPQNSSWLANERVCKWFSCPKSFEASTEQQPKNWELKRRKLWNMRGMCRQFGHNLWQPIIKDYGAWPRWG